MLSPQPSQQLAGAIYHRKQRLSSGRRGESCNRTSSHRGVIAGDVHAVPTVPRQLRHRALEKLAAGPAACSIAELRVQLKVNDAGVLAIDVCAILTGWARAQETGLRARGTLPQRSHLVEQRRELVPGHLESGSSPGELHDSGEPHSKQMDACNARGVRQRGATAA